VNRSSFSLPRPPVEERIGPDTLRHLDKNHAAVATTSSIVRKATLASGSSMSSQGRSASCSSGE